MDFRKETFICELATVLRDRYNITLGILDYVGAAYIAQLLYGKESVPFSFRKNQEYTLRSEEVNETINKLIAANLLLHTINGIERTQRDTVLYFDKIAIETARKFCDYFDEDLRSCLRNYALFFYRIALLCDYILENGEDNLHIFRQRCMKLCGVWDEYWSLLLAKARGIVRLHKQQLHNDDIVLAAATTMRLVYEPRVYLIAKQFVLFENVEKYFIDRSQRPWESDAVAIPGQHLCEFAGRVCYDSFKNPRPGGNKAYLENIIKQGHGSVLEHAVFTLLITDISRACSHELVRHRHFSYSQESQRYVDYSEGIGFVVPHGLHNNEGAFHIWKEAVTASYNAYLGLLRLMKNGREKLSTQERKRLQGLARTLLPECTTTTIVVTGSVRAFRNLLEQRCSEHAYDEIRRLCNKIYELLVVEVPFLFGDYEKKELGDGTFSLVTQYKKV